MKNFIYIGLVLISFSSCSQTELVIKEAELPDGIFYTENQLEPYSGTCVIYYPNTKQIKEKMTYEGGLLHGKSISYYSNGQVKRSGQYLQGKMSGKWESWYDNGSKHYIAQYENDCLEGEYQEWHKDGSVKEKGWFAQNVRQENWVSNDKYAVAVIK